MTTIEAPRDNLYRGLVGAPIELRAEDGTDGTTLFGHFTLFDVWNEIDSYFEGCFMERSAAGSFKKTFKENRGRIKSQFDHGYDTFVGSSILGPIDVLHEDPEGPYYEVPLLDTDYNRDRVLPMLAGRLMSGESVGSVLGASYRFRVVKEEWVYPKKASTYNPNMLPERTLLEQSLYELGPVPFPALLAATAGVRSASLTDHFLERQIARNGQTARAARQLSQIAVPAASCTGTSNTSEPPAALEGSQTPLAKRSARIALAFADLP